MRKILSLILVLAMSLGLVSVGAFASAEPEAAPAPAAPAAETAEPEETTGTEETAEPGETTEPVETAGTEEPIIEAASAEQEVASAGAAYNTIEESMVFRGALTLGEDLSGKIPACAPEDAHDVYYSFTPAESGWYKFSVTSDDAGCWGLLYNADWECLSYRCIYMEAGTTCYLAVTIHIIEQDNRFTANVSRAANSGSCGDNLTWALDAGTLTISGAGAMDDYYYSSPAPWKDYGPIRDVVIGAGVTHIGSNAFDSFGGPRIERVTFLGDAPSAGEDAFNLGTVGIYPAGNATWTDEAKQAIGKQLKLFSGAASGTCGDNLTWSLDAEGVLTISGTGDMKVPYGPWRDYGPIVKSVVIEDGVTSIGEEAFVSFRNLTRLTIPGSVTSIGFGAFWDCESLTSVTIPDSVTRIGGMAFYHCSGLTSVTIPGSVTSIGERAFAECTGLTSLTLGSGLTCIEEYAFGYCESLTAVTVPDSVTTLKSGAFSHCTALTSVTLPARLDRVSESLFSGCAGLTGVSLPASVTDIAYEAFLDCSALTSVTVPASVKELGFAAFASSGLTAVTFQGGAPEISYGPTGEEVFDVVDVETPVFDNVTATAYYYKSTSGWTEAIQAELGKKLTWKALDGAPETDPGAEETPKPDEAGALVSEDKTVTVAYSDGTEWADDVVLSVKPQAAGILSAAAMESYGLAKYAAYDITLTQNGVEIQPVGGKSVRVTITVPAGYVGSRCAVYHVDDATGALTDMKAQYSGGKLTFTTDHFSTYIVAERAATGADGGAGNNTGSGTGTQTGATPRTGDESNIALWAGLMALCLAGICCLTAARKKQN